MRILARVSAAFVGAVLAVAAAMPAGAQAPQFSGHAAQGGLVVGAVAPGSAVTLDGRPVRVSPGGHFLIGFGRDDTDPVTVRVRMPDGTVAEHRIAVEKRDFPVQRIDGLPPVQVTPDPAIVKRIQAENALIAAVRGRDSAFAGFESGLLRPVEGRVSGVFGSQRILNGQPRSPHSGLDIAADEGTPVVAMADGVVELAHPDMFYTGKTLMIDHGHGLTSVYAHLDSIAIEAGQAVKRGQVVGTVGRTGRATGPHLHWGVSLFDVKLDPALVVGPGS